MNPPLDRSPPIERLESQEERSGQIPEKIERSETVEGPEKTERSEAVERLKKMERSEAVAKPEKIRKSEAVAKPEKIGKSEAVARLEPDGMRIYWKADPPEGREGGGKRTASRWYRTCYPDRVLPKEAVIP